VQLRSLSFATIESMAEFRTEITIGKSIGSGFFSEVFEADDPVHGTVAVKVLRQAAGEADAEWLLRKDGLLAEGQRLKAAEHQNVVRVLNLFRAPPPADLLHLVCEFCNGGCLQSDFENGPMRLNKVRRVITEICRGLEAIHSRGMLHRDIKPANLLRSNGCLKLGDFGLVTDKIVVGYASGQGYTDHLAPEVLKKNLTSIRSDVWALGMTIYRLLHGEAFYDAFVAKLDIEAEVSRGGFASKLPWLAHIPSDWRRFIRKAMHDESSLRYQSALALSQAAGRLPTDPKWTCDFNTTDTTWMLQKPGKTIHVRHHVASARKHTWVAESIASGKRRRLNGSKRPVSGSAVQAGLEKFFAR
jgi:serine/threonine protein kinase